MLSAASSKNLSLQRVSHYGAFFLNGASTNHPASNLSFFGPMYRRNSQADLFESSRDSIVLKTEPQEVQHQPVAVQQSTNGSLPEQPIKKENVPGKQQANGISENGDPYEFSDGREVFMNHRNAYYEQSKT